MIYIVEDDINIRQMESYALQNSGYATAEFDSSTAFFEACRRERPELVLLDIMLPGEDGLQILRHIRQDTRLETIPVIMVTAKTSEWDKVKGLDNGADDYITKPFGIMELISRVKAVLRRSQQVDNAVLRFGCIMLDDDQHLVTVDGEICELTFKEYELLKCLLANQRIVMTREKLMDKVWGMDYEGETRTVDMHIKTLRKKLRDGGELIKTVRNVGYKIDG